MADQVKTPRLQRSRRDRMFLGVAGGLGEYFGIDPVLVRLGFVVVTLAGGAGLLAYIVLAIVMPESSVPEEGTAAAPHPTFRRETSQLAGWLLVGLGLVLLASTSGWATWLRWDLLWPLVLVLMGAALLLRRPGGTA